jgi:hypothetical protein
MKLYQALIDAKIEVSNHESDLYFPVTAQTTAILLQFPLHFNNATRFHDQRTGVLCYDVPFAYDPFWEAKLTRV